MPNSITNLTAARRRLVERKRELQREYESAIREIDVEISHIDDALKLIEEAASRYSCKACGGSGHRTGLDAAGSREEKPCEVCHGTGFAMPK